MGIKQTVNAGLGRLGYQLVTIETVEQARRARRKPPKRGRRDRKPPQLPSHYDPAARATIQAVRPRTMTAHEKLHALILATRHVTDHGLPGAFVECGVWRGGSMQAVARTLLDRGVRDRDLHLYDTFEGMPPPTEADRRHDGQSAAELLERAEPDAKVWAIAGLDDVRDGMRETGYPVERTHFHPGRVEETLPGAAPETIALLRLDTDWYASTRHELEHLYDRLVPGGVLILDDYGYWEGARKAVDEFLEARREPLLLVPIASGRIAVKP